MKGTISPKMRALLNNKELYRKFNSKLLSSSPREPFCVEDDFGNRVCYTPYSSGLSFKMDFHPNESPIKQKRKRNLFQILFGK